jgi:hypothetical protein
MDIAMAASRFLSPEISVAAPKPIVRGIHHLALVTDNMRMTLDFYVRVLGMPIVHGLRTPSRARPERATRTGTVLRPTPTSPIIFSTWAATVCSPSLNIRKGLPRLIATRLARCNTSHSPAHLGGIIRYWSD